jgi:hypothetical protein
VVVILGGGSKAKSRLHDGFCGVVRGEKGVKGGLK